MKRNLVDGEALADLLSCTSRTVRNLEAAGIISREGPGLGFDPLAAAVAVLRHRRDDAEGRAARAEAVKVETSLKRLKMERQVARLVDRDELRDLAADLWESTWATWQAATSLAFHRLAASLPEADVRAALGEVDEWVKSDLRALRERLEARVAGAAVDLAQPERVERLLARLAGGDGE
jgi:DNA-binding Lrp family transcriptional regulator